ncbi:hypothetical protein [Streptacidiphilus pinicola]|nr:hypothetical protein [Streptacidiphilus pinicola]
MRLRSALPAPALATAACALVTAAGLFVAVPASATQHPTTPQGVAKVTIAAKPAPPRSGGLSWGFYSYLQVGHPLPFDVTGFSQDKAPIMACVQYQQSYGPVWHTLGCTKPDVYKTKGQLRIGFNRTGYYGIGVELLERVHGKWVHVTDTYGNPQVTVVGTRPVKNPKPFRVGSGTTDMAAKARPADWNTMVPETVTPADWNTMVPETVTPAVSQI